MAVSASQVVFAIDFFDVMWFGCKTDLVEILGKKHALHMLGQLGHPRACGMRHVQVFSCMVSMVSAALLTVSPTKDVQKFQPLHGFQCRAVSLSHYGGCFGALGEVGVAICRNLAMSLS